MLSHLHIRNYALIDALEIEFTEGLNIITGETGAGKSILLGALSLVLGERADSSVMRDPSTKCSVEAAFQLGALDLQDFFDTNDLDYDEHSIIRREINPSGKSRAFINDTPVNLSVLRELVAKLVDLNRQHDTLELNTRDFQFLLLDALAGNKTTLDAYQKTHKAWKIAERTLEEFRQSQQSLKQEQDYVDFQLKELDGAELEDENELESLEVESTKAEHATAIQESLSKAFNLLSNAELNAMDLINEVQSALRSVSSYDPAIEALSERLKSAQLEIQDLSRETESLAEGSDLDEERFTWLRERIDLLNGLMKKHRCNELSELIVVREEYRSKWQAVSGSEEKLNQLKADTERLRNELEALGSELSAAREAQVPGLEDQTRSRLAGLGIPSASFKVVLERDRPNEYGLDKLQFLFSANKGIAEEPLSKVASGGELSRLMLSLKSMIAAETALPCLIFDEIDTGVSGEVALQLGQTMQELGKAHQLIAITHLPQIAAKGETHFFVFKQENEERSSTHIKKLTFDERKVELAKMLSGDQYSQAALENASQLLN